MGTYRCAALGCSRRFKVVSPLLLIGLSAQAASVVAKSTANSPERNQSVDSIILHTIGGPECIKGKVVFRSITGSALRWKRYFENHKVLGIHFIIDRNGLLESSIPTNKVANHTLGWNQRSIGVELVNRGDGKEPFSVGQIQTLVELVRILRVRYKSITPQRVLRHSDVDHTKFKCANLYVKRKQDPGFAFDYQKFKSAAFE